MRDTDYIDTVRMYDKNDIACDCGMNQNKHTEEVKDSDHIHTQKKESSCDKFLNGVVHKSWLGILRCHHVFLCGLN